MEDPVACRGSAVNGEASEDHGGGWRSEFPFRVVEGKGEVEPR